MGLIRTLRRGAALATLGVAGGAAFITARHLLATPQPLRAGLPGEGHIDRRHGGDLYYTVAGPEGAAPLVLLHDFYPGASSFAFRRVFARLAVDRRVYAPDWLGFGMSEHPAVAYTGEFYATMLTGFLRDTVARPATVLAHGRAANIAIRAASDTPAIFERLVLVAPPLFPGAPGEPTLTQTLVRTTQRLGLGLVPYAALSTRTALRLLAARRSARVASGLSGDETIDHLYFSAHQFGGQHALLALLTGELDLPAQNAFALLEPPVLVIGGNRDTLLPREELEDLTALNPYAELRFIDGASDDVFEDNPEAFTAAVRDWLATPATRHVVDESAFALGVEPEPERAPETPSAPAEEAAEEMLGEPGAVVPGVSNSGHEGPATVDFGGGVTTLEEPTVTLGAADVSATEAPGAPPPTETEAPFSPDDLPEAGEARPADEAEPPASEDEPPASEDETPGAEAETSAPMPRVETPETAVRTADEATTTPAADIATSERVVQTPEDDAAREAAAPDMDTLPSPPEDHVEHAADDPPAGPPRTTAAPDRPSASQRAQRATSRTPREPSPRVAPGERGSSAGGGRRSTGGRNRSGSEGQGGTRPRSSRKK